MEKPKIEEGDEVYFGNSMFAVHVGRVFGAEHGAPERALCYWIHAGMVESKEIPTALLRKPIEKRKMES